MIIPSMDENRTADRSLNTKETIQNETKLALIKSLGDQKSS